MDYFGNLKKSLAIWWEHKYLWILGIILAFFTSNNFNFNTRGNFNSGEMPSVFQDRLDKIAVVFSEYIESLQTVETWVWIVLGISVLLFVLLAIVIHIFFHHTAYSALVCASQKAYEGKYLGFRKSFSLGIKNYIRHFFYRLLLEFPIFFLVVVSIFSAFGLGYYGSVGVERSSVIMILPVLLTLFCGVLILVFFWQMLVSIINSSCVRFLLWKNFSIWQSIKSGTGFLLDNFGDYFLSWLLYFVVSIVIAIPLVIAMFFILFIICLVFSLSCLCLLFQI